MVEKIFSFKLSECVGVKILPFWYSPKAHSDQAQRLWKHGLGGQLCAGVSFTQQSDLADCYFLWAYEMQTKATLPFHIPSAALGYGRESLKGHQTGNIQPKLTWMSPLEGGSCEGWSWKVTPESVMPWTPGLGRTPSSLATPPTEKFVPDTSQHRRKRLHPTDAHDE